MMEQKRALYFIGYHIEGEAGVWHRNLTASVARECGLPPLHKKIPPHITVFRPFFSSDITPVEAVVRKVLKESEKRGTFHLSGFGSFGTRVAFIHIKADPPTKRLVHTLRRALVALPDMPREQAYWRPHATIATKLSLEAFGKVERYLDTVASPHFAIPFDNITIFKFIDAKRWEVYRRFDISG